MLATGWDLAWYGLFPVSAKAKVLEAVRTLLRVGNTSRVFGRPGSSTDFLGDLEGTGAPKHGGSERCPPPPFSSCSCCMKDHRDSTNPGVLWIFLIWRLQSGGKRGYSGSFLEANHRNFLLILSPTSNQLSSVWILLPNGTCLLCTPSQGLAQAQAPIVCPKWSHLIHFYFLQFSSIGSF